MCACVVGGGGGEGGYARSLARACAHVCAYVNCTLIYERKCAYVCVLWLAQRISPV